MNMNICCHKAIYSYTVSAEVISLGCDTCGYGSESVVYINRYCSSCKTQLGVVERDQVSEFSSLEELFKDIK